MNERVGHFNEGVECFVHRKSLQKQVRTACTITMLFVMLLTGVFFSDTAYGQEAAVSLSGGGTYEKDDVVTLTVKYTGGTFGSATGRITYDSDILTYQSCSGAEAHGSGGTVVFNMSDGTGKDSLQCKLKFKASSAGKSTVKLNTSDIYNIDLTEMSATDKNTSITIKNTSKSAASNADLASLKVSAGELSPAFSKNVTAYTVRVGKNVEQCSITAVKEDNKAKLSVSGSGKLSVGDNVRKIIVTAENGKTKTYVITINRAAKNGNTDTLSSGGKDGSDPDAQQTDDIDNHALLADGNDTNTFQQDANDQIGGNSASGMDQATKYLLVIFGVTLAVLLMMILVLRVRILKDSVKKSSRIERKGRTKKI